MPQKIRAYSIWRKFIPRFDVEPGTISVPEPAIGDIITPISDVDRMLETYERQAPALDLSASAGTHVVAQGATANQRLTILWVHKPATTANSAISVSLLSVGGAAATFQLTLVGAAEEILYGPFVIQDGDSVGMLTTGDAGDNARTFRIRYMTEVIPRV